MVAALSCQQQTQYNAFVIKFRDHLVEHGRLLRGFYNRVHGGSGKRQMNAMVTRLANAASQRSMDGYAGFCQQSSLLFAEAKSIQVTEFDTLLYRASLIGKPIASPCDGVVVGYGVASGETTKQQ